MRADIKCKVFFFLLYDDGNVVETSSRRVQELLRIGRWLGVSHIIWYIYIAICDIICLAVSV